MWLFHRRGGGTWIWPPLLPEYAFEEIAPKTGDEKNDGDRAKGVVSWTRSQALWGCTEFHNIFLYVPTASLLFLRRGVWDEVRGCRTFVSKSKCISETVPFIFCCCCRPLIKYQVVSGGRSTLHMFGVLLFWSGLFRRLVLCRKEEASTAVLKTRG